MGEDFPPDRNMKPLLSVALKEALHLALIDSIGSEDTKTRREWETDIDAIPDDALARVDLTALGQNLACRFLGSGGWELPHGEERAYTGNLTATEIWELSIDRPDRDQIAETAFDLGLEPTDDGMFKLPDDPSTDTEAPDA